MKVDLIIEIINQLPITYIQYVLIGKESHIRAYSSVENSKDNLIKVISAYKGKIIMTKKELFLSKISDLLSNYFYYDRKNDEDLSAKDVDEMISNKEVTEEELIEAFTIEIKKALKENF